MAEVGWYVFISVEMIREEEREESREESIGIGRIVTLLDVLGDFSNKEAVV